ncbi:hypothetical protein [Bacillus sp. AK128]
MKTRLKDGDVTCICSKCKTSNLIFRSWEGQNGETISYLECQDNFLCKHTVNLGMGTFDIPTDTFSILEQSPFLSRFKYEKSSNAKQQGKTSEEISSLSNVEIMSLFLINEISQRDMVHAFEEKKQQTIQLVSSLASSLGLEVHPKKDKEDE